MKKYFDSYHNRLVYYGQSANPAYWDQHWKTDDYHKAIKNKRNTIIVKTTKAYLPVGARVVDGGCGLGDKVYSLYNHGFEAYGVDFAKDTVKIIQTYAPEIHVSVGDVRKLHYPDNFFDGYWSLGVIEHFYDGFGDIVNEMYRVIRPGGFLFLTVPEMSVFRQYLAKKGKYPDMSCLKSEQSLFYQFAYPPNFVKNEIKQHGFKFLKYRPMEGVKGFKDESIKLKPFFQWIYNHHSLPIKAVKRALDIIMSPLTGHTGIYIFKK
ncbi:Methyltransferase type 11 domain protein [Candidatus Magnetomorum sp. HK-1]|nr:Methyltransferase type 11 domain protein [Candidatus Magnetomorum sp. HK-1]